MIPRGESVSLHHCNYFAGLAGLNKIFAFSKAGFSIKKRKKEHGHQSYGLYITELLLCLDNRSVIALPLNGRSVTHPYLRKQRQQPARRMASSSLSIASTVTQGPVALPLFKFSHCTSPNPQAKMIWTHLPQRSDMFAVFDVIRKVGTGMVASETKVLKLVRGGELLVCIFLRIFQLSIPHISPQGAS